MQPQCEKGSVSPLWISDDDEEEVLLEQPADAGRSSPFNLGESCSHAILCKPSCSCKRVYRHYFFRSKALTVVLLLNALFSTALYGVTSEILKIIIGDEYVLTRNLVMHGFLQIMFPIAGHIADTYAGKHNVIRYSLWVAWVGFAILGVSFSMDSFNDSINTMNKFIMLPVTFLLLNVAYVCFMSTIIPFGMDQLQGASHVHYRSFFYWWYWTLNVGVVLINVMQYCRAHVEMGITIQAEVGILCVSAALMIDALLKHWFVIEPNTSKHNPLAQIAKILRHTIAIKHTNQWVPSSVRHEMEKSDFQRLDLSKKRYGGKYETEEVENVKTFFRMLLVLFSVGFPVFSYAGVFGTVGLVAAHMYNSLASAEFGSTMCKVEFTITDAISAILLLSIIPLLDLLLVPLMRSSYPSILKRLGFGASLVFLSIMVLFLMEAFGKHSQMCMFSTGRSIGGSLEINVYWVILPLAILTLAEIFIFIPCFEFICAQSPSNMRSLLIGVFFSIQGMFSLLAVVLQYIFSWERVYDYPFIGKTGYSCAFWYYLILVVLSLAGLLVYFIVASKYKRRQRDDVFNSLTLIEEYFSCGGMVNVGYMYNDNQDVPTSETYDS